MLKRIMLTTILFSFSIIVFFASGYFSPCLLGSYSIYYGPSTSRIYLSCTGSQESLSLKTIDPVSLNVEREFTMGGLVEKVIPINNGSALLVLLTAVDSDENSPDAVLRKIDAQTGQIIDELFYPNQFAWNMVADCNDEYVFVTLGVDDDTDEEPPCVKKVDIDNLEIVGTVEFGELSDEIEISDNQNKIFVGSSEAYGGGYMVLEGGEEIAVPRYWEIGVFNTSDLSECEPIKFNHPYFSIEMGNSNRLFVSIEAPKTYSSPAFIIVNTINYEMQQLRFDGNGDIGVLFMSFNPYRNEIYCTTSICTSNEPEADYCATNRILKFDLGDYSYEFFQLGFDNLWQTALACTDNFNRLFCTSEKSNRVHYMDID